MNNTRAQAARILFDVLEKNIAHAQLARSQRRSATRSCVCAEICYGALRWLPRLEARIESFLKKKAQMVLLTPITRRCLPTRLYASASPQLSMKPSPPQLTPLLKNLINAVLRKAQQSQAQDIAENTSSTICTPTVVHRAGSKITQWCRIYFKC